MVYLDYVENYLDPLNEPARRVFENSNIVCDIDRIMHLDARVPYPEWVEDHFCNARHLINDIVSSICTVN